MPEEPTESTEPISDRPAVLPYQRQVNTPVVTVRTFYDAMEAQLYANELEVAGIDYNLTNQNTNTLGPYAAFSQVELQVREEDVADAQRLLSQLELDPTDVEPEQSVDPTAPLPDPSGEGTLVTAVAFDNPRAMFDAAAVLGAARVDCILPVLVARGERPRGTGDRFVVRVREADLKRAREILASRDDVSNEEDDEPRCPKCGSWRTYPVPASSGGLAGLLFGRAPEETRQLECLRCHHRWPA
ncbi:MAG TPA: DUF2007 domain-containing protein [Tepidisphaeraceae bacterium]|jgi:DNA-directed RNA polymerase subunit RPC12/RpoP